MGNSSSPPKNVSVKQSQQLQAVMESLVQKVDTQTAIIVGLQASVDSMNDTLSQQKTTVVESVRLNNEIISSIKRHLSETPRSNQNAKKPSYAKMVKDSTNKVNVSETPTSSKKHRIELRC